MIRDHNATHGKRKFKRVKLSYDTRISPRYDSYDDFVAIKEEFLLGDILFLASEAPQELKFKGKEDVNVGNEGFNGQIFSNLAIIARF